MLVRVQGNFPATGEVLSPFTIGHFVAGFMRGSHHGALMPVKRNTSISYFDGPPIVSCLAFCVKNGKLTEPADAFDHPYWEYVRTKVSAKSEDLRRQGFFGPARRRRAVDVTDRHSQVQLYYDGPADMVYTSIKGALATPRKEGWRRHPD